MKEQYPQCQNLTNSIVFVMADMVESRDKGMGCHIERVTTLIKILIHSMIERGVYSAELNRSDVEMLSYAACLHDVGKISVPDTILSKPDRLTDKEYEIMKTHVIEGERIIDKIVSRAGVNEEFLQHAKLFAGYHHERWDGKGYPRGLDRLNIPLQGRIMAIIDVYDALVSERPYKKPFTSEEAVKIIMDSTGEMFDPIIADVFFEIRNLLEMVEK